MSKFKPRQAVMYGSQVVLVVRVSGMFPGCYQVTNGQDEFRVNEDEIEGLRMPGQPEAWRIVDKAGKTFFIENKDLVDALVDLGQVATPMAPV